MCLRSGGSALKKQQEKGQRKDEKKLLFRIGRIGFRIDRSDARVWQIRIILWKRIS